MVTDRGPFVLLDIGATTDSTGLNLAQYAHMGALYAERVLGVAEPDASHCCRSARKRGKGEQRVKDATALLTAAATCASSATSRAATCREHPADVVVCDASVGNVVMKFFEGVANAMLRPAARRVQATALGTHRLPVHAPGHRPHPAQVRLRAARVPRRCWASTAPCSSPTAVRPGG